MMKKMRENTRTILLILVFAFILTIVFSWGMGGFKITKDVRSKGIIGVVNGQSISYHEFRRRLEQVVDDYRQSRGIEPSESDFERFIDQVWESLVTDVLIAQEVKRRKITVTDEEILDHIHAFVRRDTTFYTNGKFDNAKYQEAVRNPAYERYWLLLEDQIRHDLPRLKLQDRVIATVRVTDEEIKREFIRENIKAKAQYIFFDPNRFKDRKIEVTDAEVQAYYQQHLESFREPEKRRIDYVLFEVKPTPEDTSEIWADAEDLVARIKEGEDFAELAKAYSEDPGSASKGGDLGYIEKGSMVKPFEEAAFAAPIGEVVGPIRSPLGLHIIQVEAKKIENGREKAKTRHILLKFKASSKTIEDIRDKANYFATEAKEGGFYAEAEAQNLKVEKTPFFARGGFIPGIGIENRVSRFVFRGKLGEVSDALRIRKGFIVLRIAGIKEEGIKPLSKVKENIRNIILRNKRRELAGQFCAQVRGKISRGEDFQRVALEDSLEIKETDFFSLDDYIPGVGREPKFTEAAFSLRVGEVSRPVETARGYYLIKLLEKTPFDQEAFQRDKEGLKIKLLTQKRRSAFTNWLSSLKRRAKIKDYRDLYF